MNDKRRARAILTATSLTVLFAFGPNGCKSSDDSGDETSGTGTSCSSDKECREFDLLCDTSRRVCVECLTLSHCGDRQICAGGTCVDITPCENSRDCPDDQVCADDLGRCVECAADADCASGNVCAGYVCRVKCDSDKDCQSVDLLCDTALGHCVDCSNDDDCSEGQYCNLGSCTADVCDEGSSRCDDDQLLTCNASGSGYMAETCSDGCVEDGDEASCDGPSTGGQSGAEAGAPPISSEGGATATGGTLGAAGEAPISTGGTGGAEAPTGGTSGGATPTGGKASGGTGGTVGTGGTQATGGMSSVNPFPPVTSACALLSGCSDDCCAEVGVFALDALDEPATETLVTSFTASTTSVSAQFAFTGSGQLGAIYFGLASRKTFEDLTIDMAYAGGNFELALSRGMGAEGCSYEGSSGAWELVGCWPTIDTGGSWDQVEIRVRSVSAASASLTITGLALDLF
jgi:Cys-rich repeat protein